MFDLIKTTFPLLIFILGMLFTPFIESMKLKAKSRGINKTIINEIEDEYETIKKSISTLDQSITTRKGMQKEHIHLSLPNGLNMIILKNNITDVYPVANKHYRRAYKALLDLQISIAEQHKIISENYKNDNIKCLLAEMSMQHSMLLAYYLMSKLLSNGDFFEFPTIPDEEMVNNAASSLGVKVPFK